MTEILLVSMLVAFLGTFLITPYVIRYFKFVKIITSDVHKKGKPLIPSSAGVSIAMGIIGGLLLYIFLTIFILKTDPNLIVIFASMTGILIITFSGVFDDINAAQTKVGGYDEGKKGLKRWQKPLLTIPAALPLMAIFAGTTEITLPIAGTVDIGILYPLLLVPIGVVGAANMVNMLGGFNGLEIGMGLVYTLSLGIFAFMNERIVASVLFLITFAALLGISRYNFPPARILSGDSTSYLLGAIVAVGAIIGNMEKAAIIVMIPFIIQGILKFYSRFKLGKFASDLGELQKDGTIKSRYGNKIYSLTHLAMNLGKMTEKKIVLFLIVIQAIFSLLPFLNIF